MEFYVAKWVYITFLIHYMIQNFESYNGILRGKMVIYNLDEKTNYYMIQNFPKNKLFYINW